VSAIKTLCAKIRKSFFEAINENPLSASLMVGNLYLAYEKADEEECTLINVTLQQLKEKLTKQQVQILWNTVTDLQPRQLRLMRDSIRTSLKMLKSTMIDDSSYFEHLTTESLIKVGQHPQLYREVMIALIRKHLAKNNVDDPFVQPTFDYELLRSFGAEQNHLYMAEFIKECESLPLQDLVKLGSERHEIASLMLMDLKNNEMIFELGSRFARIHPNLREEIAQHWRSYFETFPITAKQEKYVQGELPKLKKAFPEFSEVSIQSRIKRNYQVAKADENYELFKESCVRCFKLGFFMSLPANVYTLPLFVGYGINSMYSIVNERNKAARRAQDLLEANPIKKKLSL
jgi:hypothetical protein